MLTLVVFRPAALVVRIVVRMVVRIVVAILPAATGFSTFAGAALREAALVGSELPIRDFLLIAIVLFLASEFDLACYDSLYCIQRAKPGR